jgi:endonuclease/exonuclease/phosphatase family metal-dependent hydrolase
MIEVEPTIAAFLPEEKIEFGESPPLALAETHPSKLIVASYNIRYAVGRYLISSGVLRKLGLNPPFRREQAVLRNIAAAAKAFSQGSLMPKADILALQEADRRTKRAGGVHVTQELANELEMTWVHVPAGLPRGVLPVKRQWWLDFEEQIGVNDLGDTGVALLSRFPLTDVTRIDLPWHDCAWRPRLALGATIKIGSTELHVFNAHIDPHPDANGQMEQLETMMEHADRFRGPTIVMGDFNTLSQKKCLDARSLMEKRGFSTPIPTGTPTWRGAALSFHADWIFGRDVSIARWGIVRPLSTSDHWPIWAEIEL